MEREMLHTVYLGLGANLGDREQTILRAYRHIARLIGPLKGHSAFFYSEPWGFQSEHGFVNSVAAVLTACTPREVLHRTKLIERRLGKTRSHATARDVATVYHDRPIDIDILLYDDRRIDDPDLHIPHPLMSQRPFVMQPLREVMALTGDHNDMMP